MQERQIRCFAPETTRNESVTELLLSVSRLQRLQLAQKFWPRTFVPSSNTAYALALRKDKAWPVRGGREADLGPDSRLSLSRPSFPQYPQYPRAVGSGQEGHSLTSETRVPSPLKLQVDETSSPAQLG